MKIFGMGGFELVIILIVILLIFGPKNLPKLGSALGKTVSNLRSGMNEGKKGKDAEKADAEPAEPADTQVAEIEGEVETVTVDDDGQTAEVVDDAEDAVAPESEQAPKKVRRVVKKKVVSAEAPETE